MVVWRCARVGRGRAAAQAIPRASTTPDALQWLACARYRQHGLAAARSALFALAWHAPQRLASALAELQDELLDRDWQRFTGACEWDSVADAELPASSLRGTCTNTRLSGTTSTISMPRAASPPEAARLLNDILDLESRGDWHKLASARDKLRKLNEDGSSSTWRGARCSTCRVD